MGSETNPALKQAYPWLFTKAKVNWSLSELDAVLQAHNVTDKELAQYAKVDRKLRMPIHWRTIADLHKAHKLCNTADVVDDSEAFIAAFELNETYDGRLARDKLYSLYYIWSKLPMSKEMFCSIFQRKYYPIPKESSMIRAFLVKKKKQTERTAEAMKRRAELAEIVYGRKEEIKKTLWNFW